MLPDIDRELLSEERRRLVAGDAIGYCRLELLSEIETYSDDDPLGRGNVMTTQYLTIPARVVWGSRDRRVMEPRGGYLYVRSDVTLYAIPATYAQSLAQGRVLLVPRPYETGTSENTCRILELSRDPKTDTLIVYCTKTG